MLDDIVNVLVLIAFMFAVYQWYRTNNCSLAMPKPGMFRPEDVHVTTGPNDNWMWERAQVAQPRLHGRHAYKSGSEIRPGRPASAQCEFDEPDLVNKMKAALNLRARCNLPRAIPIANHDMVPNNGPREHADVKPQEHKDHLPTDKLLAALSEWFMEEPKMGPFIWGGCAYINCHPSEADIRVGSINMQNMGPWTGVF